MVKKRKNESESEGDATLEKIAELQKTFLARMPTSAGLKLRKKLSGNFLRKLTKSDVKPTQKTQKMVSSLDVKAQKSPLTSEKAEIKRPEKKAPVAKGPQTVPPTQAATKAESEVSSQNQTKSPSSSTEQEKQENIQNVFQKAKSFFSSLGKKPK